MALRLPHAAAAGAQNMENDVNMRSDELCTCAVAGRRVGLESRRRPGSSTRLAESRTITRGTALPVCEGIRKFLKRRCEALFEPRAIEVFVEADCG